MSHCCEPTLCVPRRLSQVARQDCTPQPPRPRVLLCWVRRQAQSSRDALKSLPRLPGSAAYSRHLQARLSDLRPEYP